MPAADEPPPAAGEPPPAAGERRAPVDGVAGETTSAPSFRTPRVAALILVVGGLFLLYHAFQIGSVRGYSVVGPSIFPIVVSVVVTVLGIVLAVRTTLFPDGDLGLHVTREAAATYWPTIGLLTVVLVVYALALGPLGYIVATAILLPVAARIMGSRSLIRDVVVGVALAVVVFIGFTRFMQIRLPDGVLAPFM